MTEIKKELKIIVNLSIPVVTGQLGHMMMGVVDSVMVGRLGAVPLAAASLSNSIFFLIMVVGIGFSYGITPYVAMAHGSGENKKCGVVLRQGLISGFFVTFVLTVLTLSVSNIIPYLKQPETVTKQAIPYLNILGWSVIPMMLFQIYRQFIEGLSVMKPAMVITVIANLFNGFFNWIFIYGHLGFSPQGLKGAGIATLLTRSLMALVLIGYVMKTRRFKKYDPTLHYKTFDLDLNKKLLKLGLASGVQYFFEVGAFTVSAVIIGWFGASQLAAHQISLNLAAITYMFGLGISSASAVRVGNAIGRKDLEAAKKTGFTAMVLAITVMGFFGILFVFLRDFLPTLYIDDMKVIKTASSLLLVAALFQMSDGAQVVLLGALRGVSDIKFPTYITFTAYWVIGLPFGYFLGVYYNLKAIGVWLGLFLGLTVSAVLLSLRFGKIVTKEKL
jgi:MATE family multidrug resistance protein